MPQVEIELGMAEVVFHLDVEAVCHTWHQMTVVVDVGGNELQNQMNVVVDMGENEIGTAFLTWVWVWVEQPTVELVAFQCPMHHAHLANAL